MADRTQSDDGDRTGVVTVVVAAVAFIVAVVAAVVRALVGGWYPVGDNANFALRSQDVLTEHHPLLGTWTSASQTVGFHFNNPGPLLYDVLAVPAKIDPTLVPIGVGFLVLASVATMSLFAARVAGHRGVVAVLFASAALAWAMGPELLIDPWQPHALLFPFLALIGVTWASWAGSDGALVGAVGLGSFVVQTHLSYAPLVATLCSSALLVVVVRALRDRARRRHAWRMLGAAAVVILVLWSQPLVEQFTADERGNLSRIADVAGEERGESLGVARGVRVAGTLLSPVPRWMPGSFADAYEPVPYVPGEEPGHEGMPSTTTSAASIIGAIVALAVVGLLARRRSPRLFVAVPVVGVSVIVAVATTISLPVTIGLPPHHIRWLWPTAIAVTTVLVACVLARRTGVLLVAAATVVMAMLAIVPTHPEIGPTADEDAGVSLRALAPQLDVLRGRGPLQLELDGTRVYEPYTLAVVLELQNRGVDVRVAEPGLVRQLGPERAATGSERGKLYVWQGGLAVSGRRGLDRVAFVAALDVDEQDELDRRTTEVLEWIRAGELHVTDRGREAVRARRFPDLEALMAPDVDAFAEAGAGIFRAAIEEGYLGSTRHQDDLDRWVDLLTRFERQTVGVWVDWVGD